MKTLQNVEEKIVQSGTRIGGISNAVLSTVGLSLLCLFPLGLFSNEILPTDPNIRYVGRFDTTTPLQPRMHWSGSHIIAWFEGTSCQVRLQSAPKGKDVHVGNSFINIIVDDGIPVVFELVDGDQTIAAASELPDGIHKIEIFKRTSWLTGGIALLGLITDEGKGLAALPPAPVVKIEFYGDSITDGHSVDAPSDSDALHYFNNYLTYGAVTARNLGMEYVSIGSSGIAVLYPVIGGYTMGNYYRRIDPGESGPSNVWDFSKYTADIVVINLIGVDSGVNPQPYTTTEQNDIIAAYLNFLLKIRARYPDAEIICTLCNTWVTPLGSVWNEYIESAVARMNTTLDDGKVRTFFFTTEAADVHPLASEHELMAGELTSYIQDNLGYLFEDPLIGGTAVDGLPGWFLSDWLGYYSTAFAPWIFHAEHGFVFRFTESTNESTYFYDHAMGAWWWTSSTVYPSLYRFTDGSWLWYQEGTKGPRWFNNLSEGGWESW